MPIQAFNTRILVDRYDLSGMSNALALAIDSTAIEYNVFQDPAKQFVAGNPTSTLQHNGYYTGPGASELENVLYSYMTANGQVTAILGTNQPVPVAYVIPTAYNGQMTIDSPVNELITLQGTWNVSAGQLYRGYQLWYGQITATGAKPGVDFGAAGASGGKAWLHFISSVGTVTNGTVVVESDDNVGMTSPTARGTFTFSTSGDHSLEINLAAVERYLRINATGLGGATNYTIAVIAGAAGLTY